MAITNLSLPKQRLTHAQVLDFLDCSAEWLAEYSDLVGIDWHPDGTWNAVRLAIWRDFPYYRFRSYWPPHRDYRTLARHLRQPGGPTFEALSVMPSHLSAFGPLLDMIDAAHIAELTGATVEWVHSPDGRTVFPLAKRSVGYRLNHPRQDDPRMAEYYSYSRLKTWSQRERPHAVAILAPGAPTFAQPA